MTTIDLNPVAFRSKPILRATACAKKKCTTGVALDITDIEALAPVPKDSPGDCVGNAALPTSVSIGTQVRFNVPQPRLKTIRISRKYSCRKYRSLRAKVHAIAAKQRQQTVLQARVISGRQPESIRA